MASVSYPCKHFVSLASREMCIIHTAYLGDSLGSRVRHSGEAVNDSPKAFTDEGGECKGQVGGVDRLILQRIIVRP